MAIQYTATDFLNKLSANNFSYTNSYKKKVREANTDVETLQEDIIKLKKTVKSLGKYSEGVTSKTRLEKQLESLVKTYNSMDKDTGKISNDELAKQMDKFDKLFSENEKSLKKVGLKKSDGKLEFDSEVFEDAEDKFISKLFEGKDSFIKQADKLIRRIEECADNAQYSMVERTFGSTIRYGTEEMQLAHSFVLAKETTRILAICGGLMEMGALTEEYEEELKTDLGIFSGYVYNNANYYEDENYDKLQALCEDKKEELSKIGLTFNENLDGKNEMMYDDTIDIDSAEFQEAYISLFGNNSEFVNNITDCCSNGFDSVLNTEKIGVSIVDEYV